jgi:hypothetical protein
VIATEIGCDPYLVQTIRWGQMPASLHEVIDRFDPPACARMGRLL